MEREKKIIKTSIFGIVVNVVLVIFKMIIGLITNSIAIILDALNNLSDTISSIVTIIGTKIANKGPDREHPFGHGRVEYFTSVIVSAIVLVAGIMALDESVKKIIDPANVTYTIVSLIIVGVTVFVKFFFGRYVKKVGRELNSQSLIASGEDAFMDSVLSLSTLVAGIINYVWHYSIEGYIGILISFVIGKSAIDMLKETVNIMIGQRADKQLTDKIKEKISSYDNVQGVYDLAIHTYGPTKFIGTVNIQVPDNMTAKEIHILTRQIAVDIYNIFGIIMTIGIYAANDDGEYSQIKKKILNIIDKYEHVKQLHGFFVDKTSNTIYFDLIFDFECKDRKKIMDEIVKEMKEEIPQYEYYIIIDDDITD